ncbi:NmrA family NAD(P)-binding protein [Loigolactobacillus jiayinensis]|uniref:NmrA family NAD(P)-binding protein n=1 Tax=Loigolactobacillus jiayinensis TaxID=2486016 RepID=A0ABW1RFM4_9LACO|nr:NmrA family NAD(P)-binding protein [Loigolactobacillus jiayinensis]
MQITLLGSVGHINHFLIPMLVNAGHHLTVVTHSAKRVPEIEQLGATAAIGSMSDVNFLTTVFTGANAIYLMLSGSSTDPQVAAQQQGQIFYQAAKAAGVPNIVDLSSVGANLDYQATGALSFYHFIEAALRQLTDVNIAFVRPVGFYANLLADIPTIKTQHKLFSTTPATINRMWVAPQDIATKVTNLLQATPHGHSVHYVVSDNRTGQELLTALQTALALPDLKYVTISDAKWQANLVTHGVPASTAEALMLMNRAQRHPEKIYADLYAHQPTYGQVKLPDFMQQFAAVYRGDTDEHAQTLAER